MNTWAMNIIQTAQHGSWRPCIREKLSVSAVSAGFGTFISLLATPSSTKYLAESHLRSTHTWIGNVYWQEKFQVLKLASLVLGETTSSVSSWWLICSNQTMFGKSIKPMLCCGNEQDIMFRPKKCQSQSISKFKWHLQTSLAVAGNKHKTDHTTLNWHTLNQNVYDMHIAI